MRKVALVVDVSNMYYCVKSKYNSKLDYKALYNYVKPLGDVHKAIAYGAQLEDEAKGFIDALKHAGYEPRFKKPKTYSTENGIRRKADWDVTIALELIQLGQDMDLIVLACADGDLAPAVQQVLDSGCKVLVIGCNISSDLKSLTQFVEVPPSMLEQR